MTELSQPTKVVVRSSRYTDDIDDMLFHGQLGVQQHSQIADNVDRFNCYGTNGEGVVVTVRWRSVDRKPSQIGSVFAALSCSCRDTHAPVRQVGEAGRQTRQACGRQAWFVVQVDLSIVSVQMVVDLVPIEQISNVLSVGHELHRP